MKNQSHARLTASNGSPSAQRGGARPHNSKSIVHRHERRKIREQLRRADWAPGLEDGIFA